VGDITEWERMGLKIRAQWPKVRILLGEESGFRREEPIAWCVTNRVGDVIGFGRKQRLRWTIGAAMR
jgi:hypothetical protein